MTIKKTIQAALNRTRDMQTGIYSSVIAHRREVRSAAVFVLCLAATSSLSADPVALASSLSANGLGWLRWALRIIGGLMAIGGIVASVDGFTGNEEGYRKTVKVGAGLMLVAIGGYVLGNAGQLITDLGLANMFSAA